jgi:hypothetical protein
LIFWTGPAIRFERVMQFVFITQTALPASGAPLGCQSDFVAQCSGDGIELILCVGAFWFRQAFFATGASLRCGGVHAVRKVLTRVVFATYGSGLPRVTQAVPNPSLLSVFCTVFAVGHVFER